MDKAPQPSLLGLLLVIGLLVFLIWLGPIGEAPKMNDSVQHGTIDCNQNPKTLTNTQLELCIDIQSFRKNSDYE